jgi:hypothetical protein
MDNLFLDNVYISAQLDTSRAYTTTNHTTYHCCLCADASWQHSSQTSMYQHELCPSHNQKVKEMDAALSSYMIRSKEVHNLIKKTRGHDADAQFHEQLLLYLYNERKIGVGPLSSHQLHSVYERLNWNTALVLLELALWKTVCIWNAPKPNMDMMSVVEWMKNGWKTNKVVMRHHEMINIVMKCAVPFLGKSHGSREF